jgi:hypothetical protein
VNAPRIQAIKAIGISAGVEGFSPPGVFLEPLRKTLKKTIP